MINIKEIKETEFSKDNEHFNYQDDLREFIEEECLDVGSVIYAGKKDPVETSRFFDMGLLITQMQENADCSEFCEWSDDFLTGLDRDMLEKLEEKISELLDEYLPKPRFYHVKDIVKYRIVKIDGDDVFVETITI